jgi:putative DNA methylase
MSTVTAFSLKDAPALIERLLPVQKLSAEVFKERKAGAGQTLVPLGAYWKGRKPLILNKACILGCLLPATENPRRDLEVFEKLMGMDDETFAVRAKSRPKPKAILARLALADIREYFTVLSDDDFPIASPADWSTSALKDVKVIWRDDISEMDRRRIEVQMLDLTSMSYRQRVEKTQRPEEVGNAHDHIWQAVNDHLGTSAFSFPELVEQLGIMRFGRRPLLADTFSGSGQIPFEAARLGCEVHASDLNPIACMLTWGGFNIVGGSPEHREALEKDQRDLAESVLEEIDRMGVETDGRGWRAKAYL